MRRSHGRCLTQNGARGAGESMRAVRMFEGGSKGCEGLVGRRQFLSAVVLSFSKGAREAPFGSRERAKLKPMSDNWKTYRAARG